MTEEISNDTIDNRFFPPYISNKDNVVVVLGAGASISEMIAAKKSPEHLPPTDANFLARAQSLAPSNYERVQRLFDEVWKGDEPRPLKYQQMEMLFSSSYLKLQQTNGKTKAGQLSRELYDALVDMLRETLSETTRKAESKQHLDILSKIKAANPRSLNVLTFNYDVLADRALLQGARQGLWNWSHEDGYGFRPKNQPTPKQRSDIGLHKLHGSMNWYIRTPGRTRTNAYKKDSSVYVPTPASNPNAQPWQKRQFHLGHSKNKIFPLMVPPVYEKGSQIIGVLQHVWDNAAKALREATLVIVWGYSLPQTDYHSGFLFAQCARRAKFRLIAINPDRNALAHVTDVCGHAWNRWYFLIGHLLREMDGQATLTESEIS